jgi:hypothetical protein
MRSLISTEEGMEPKRSRISHDWWTVIAALLATALIKVGLLPAIPW